MPGRYNLAFFFIFKTYTKILIWSCLNDFITFCARLNIQSEGSISQFRNAVGR